MKAIVLGAGYATRLYPLTLNTPKALLEVGGKTILERVFESIFSVEACTEAIIVSNDKFYPNFCEWVQDMKNKPAFSGKNIEVVNDGTTSNDTRLGAIGDIEFAINKYNIEEDMLVLGSDNLFEFDMREFVKFALSKRPSATLALYDIKNLEKASLYGIAVADEKDSRILDFQEKPKDPKSTLAATAIYFYPKEKMEDFKSYMKSDMPKDAPGNFIKWLNTKESVYGYIFENNWYDIGDIDSLNKADAEYKKNEKNRK